MAVVKLGAEAILFQQILMLALLDHIAFVHQQDPIRIPDGGQVFVLADLAILGFLGIGEPGYDNLNFLRTLARFAYNR